MLFNPNVFGYPCFNTGGTSVAPVTYGGGWDTHGEAQRKRLARIKRDDDDIIQIAKMCMKIIGGRNGH